MTKHDYEEKKFMQLVGIYRHYCPDWDYMAIDEHSPEIEGCTCDYAINARRVPS